LLQATGATINLENQKNGVRGACVHQATSGDKDIDPVRSLARLVHRIATLNPDTPLGTFLSINGRVLQASSTDITAMIRGGAIGDNLANAGYDLTRIGTHSLRSGGAINMAINGVEHAVIRNGPLVQQHIPEIHPNRRTIGWFVRCHGSTDAFPSRRPVKGQTRVLHLSVSRERSASTSA
jgi:hypothetical protein